MPKRLKVSFIKGEDQILTSDGLQLPMFRKNTQARDHAAKAAEILLEKYNIDPSTIDQIFFSSSFPDSVNIGFGTYVQEKIKAEKAGTLQINAECSSFLYQMKVAKSFLKHTDTNKILLINVAHMASRILSHDQLNIHPFAEGAHALLIEKKDLPFAVELFSFTNAKTLSNIFPKRDQIDDWRSNAAPFVINKEEFLKFDEDEILIKDLAHNIENFLHNNNKSIDNISYLLCQNPRKNFTLRLSQKLNLSAQKIIKESMYEGDFGQVHLPKLLSENEDLIEQETNLQTLLVSFSLDKSFGACMLW